MGPADRGRSVVVDELIQGTELLHPQEKLALCVTQDFEVLDTIAASSNKIIQ